MHQSCLLLKGLQENIGILYLWNTVPYGAFWGF